MKKISQALWVTIVFCSLAFAGSVPAAAKTVNLLEFSSMVGVPQTLTGAQSQAALRGINGGGLPWMVGSAKGELSTSGRLEVSVQGLVFATGPTRARIRCPPSARW
jgi:hypothetical protein